MVDLATDNQFVTDKENTVDQPDQGSFSHNSKSISEPLNGPQVTSNSTDACRHEDARISTEPDENQTQITTSVKDSMGRFVTLKI